MDWVHCNNCFLLADREKCFYLTSCGHIFCKDCEGVCARTTCKLCGNQCTTIPLSSSMKPEVQMYFTDPDELLKTKLKEVQKIALFQRNHRARLMTYYRKELNKYRQMKDGFKKILKNLKDSESERKQLFKENETFKKIFEMSGLARAMSTPGSAVINSGGHGSTTKGNATSHSEPPSSHRNPMFSQFFNNLQNSGSGAPSAARVSVFTPPINGKFGGVPVSPSPSSALRNLKLSKNDETLITPTCTQESSNYAFNLQPESLPSTPYETWNPARSSTNAPQQSKKDPRRVVVHPYSPDE